MDLDKFVRDYGWGEPKTVTPVPWTPYGPGPWTTLQTGPQTPFTDPPYGPPQKITEKEITPRNNQKRNQTEMTN